MSSRPSCIEVVSRHFEVLEVKKGHGRTSIALGLPLGGGELEKALVEAYKSLSRAGCYSFFTRDGSGLYAHIHEPQGTSRGWMLAAVLAATTLVTVYVSGLAIGDPSRGSSWTPLAYLLGLLLPLLIHEAGHWLVMKMYRVPSSLPYLIPAPPLQLGFLGTFGAVINMRWLPPTIDSLALMSMAGPIAGFLAALPLAVIGLQTSQLLPPGEAPPGDVIGLNVAPLVMMMLGHLAGIPEGYVVILSPLAFASYVVFLVTFLNLIPVGMLDGGHLIRSVVGPRMHHAVSLGVVAASFLASIYFPPLSLFAILALLLYLATAGGHPGSAIQLSTPTWRTGAAALLYSALLVLVLPLPVAP